MGLDDRVGGLECNRRAEHVHIRWDFGGSWEALILAGDIKGSKFTCGVEKFNEEKWMTVGASMRYGTSFQNAKPDQKKGACFMFLEKHMKEVVGPLGRA